MSIYMLERTGQTNWLKHAIRMLKGSSKVLMPPIIKKNYLFMSDCIDKTQLTWKIHKKNIFNFIN